MMAWTAPTGPAWTLTRTKRAPVLAAMASAERTSFFRTLTPIGRRTWPPLSRTAPPTPAPVRAPGGERGVAVIFDHDRVGAALGEGTRVVERGAEHAGHVAVPARAARERAQVHHADHRVGDPIGKSERGRDGHVVAEMIARENGGPGPQRWNILTHVMAMTPGATASRIFYGRWVALALAIIVLLSSGVRFTIDPFLKPVTVDLGLDRGSFSLVVAASPFLSGAFLPPLGRPR